MSWILTDFDPMTGVWLSAGFNMPRVLEPKLVEKGKRLMEKLQSIDVTDHSKTAKAVVRCFIRALDHLTSQNVMNYGPLLAWAKMRGKAYVLIDMEYPFPADWEPNDWKRISTDLVTAMSNAAENLGVGLDINLGTADEMMEKSKTTTLSIKDQNLDIVHTMFGNVGLDHWKDPEGFCTVFNNDTAMMSGKLAIIADDTAFKHDVEVWMPRLGLPEDCLALPRPCPRPVCMSTCICGNCGTHIPPLQVILRRAGLARASPSTSMPSRTL